MRSHSSQPSMTLGPPRARPPRPVWLQNRRARRAQARRAQARRARPRWLLSRRRCPAIGSGRCCGWLARCCSRSRRDGPRSRSCSPRCQRCSARTRQTLAKAVDRCRPGARAERLTGRSLKTSICFVSFRCRFVSRFCLMVFYNSYDMFLSRTCRVTVRS